MPEKTKITKHVVGAFRDQSPGRSASRGRQSKRSSSNSSKHAPSPSPSRKSFVRTADEGPAVVFPPPAEVFAPDTVIATKDWGKLIAIVSLELLFFVWLKWAADIGLWSTLKRAAS
jgi:hypothetical protein